MKQCEFLHKVSFINTQLFDKKRTEFFGNSLNHEDFVQKRKIVVVLWNNNIFPFLFIVWFL
jgi:hypothetical protein